jgi:MFS family permease
LGLSFRLFATKLTWFAQHIYGLSVGDTKSPEFQSAGDWVGIIFGVYNAVSAVVAFALPYIAKQIGRRKTHALSLVLGGIGLISVYFMPNKEALIFSMILVGFAWASILAMPYAILAGSIQPKKMGVYMGIFNFFIVIPQIINALIGGPLVKYVYNDHAIYAIVMSGVSFLLAAPFKVCSHENGIIPNAKTAVVFAKIILNYHYGEEEINEEKPFDVELLTQYGTYPVRFQKVLWAALPRY